MVLTIRPPKGVGDAQNADRLTVRRAALDLMDRDGYSAVTVDDIVARVGISRRTFFRLFAGKHEVVSCDHGVYYAEVCEFLMRHDSERTLVQAAAAASLIPDGLTSVREDLQLRERIINSDPSLRAEENQWYSLYQTTLAEFLTRPQGATTSLEAEMLAASLIAAVRVALRDWLNDPTTPAPARFGQGVAMLQGQPIGQRTRRTIAIIETSHTIEQLIERLYD